MKTLVSNISISVIVSFLIVSSAAFYLSHYLHQSHEIISDRFKTEITFNDNRVIITVTTDQVTDCDELSDLLGIQPIEVSNEIYLPACSRIDEKTFVIEYQRGQEV